MNKAILTQLIALAALCSYAQDVDVSTMQHYPGFMDFYWDDSQGKIYLEVKDFDQELLYNTGLSAGVGSNDLGLDRGQLGGAHVVTFHRVGDKVLLIEKNLRFRANSDNALERRAVEEAFAQSVLWGFTVADRSDQGVLVDATAFLLRDVHGAAKRLAASKQGSYQVDASRSAIHLPRTKNFPKNTEFDALITLTGEAKGAHIQSVTPSPDAVTVRMHHSFIELPDDQYEPRLSDPRSGYGTLSYYDYATPINAPIVKRFIRRHRLEKRDPTAAVSEALEPIVYYMDSGAPEPVKSALIDGASWWNQAFEAAGYKDAFRVEVLPADADPMDVRYNVIQWVHRSTRGWSYGSSVTDPRTGEIIKGHVSLGSLRVRQDFMIAQGLARAYPDDQDDPRPLLDLALARLRQLSAHEVGHTLGLMHNFAASTNDRSSVMDYPHPWVMYDGDQPDFSDAYDVGIGDWDKRAILYGYQDFAPGVDEAKALQDILLENNALGLRYISDQDARPSHGAHPHAHLWDNGASIVTELERMIDVRQKALDRFGLDNIPAGTPTGHLENVLVPLYLGHRYQTEAVTKLIGGLEYRYAVKGEGDVTTKMVEPAVQARALDVLLTTLHPDFLTLPPHIIELIPPRPAGYQRDRELFKTRTGLTFDPMGAAEAAASYTLDFLLHPQRMSRLIEHHSRDSRQPSMTAVLERISDAVFAQEQREGLKGAIGDVVLSLFVEKLIELAVDQTCHHQVRGAALQGLERVQATSPSSPSRYAIHRRVDRFMAAPEEYRPQPKISLPDGSPIGCGGHFD